MEPNETDSPKSPFPASSQWQSIRLRPRHAVGSEVTVLVLACRGSGSGRGSGSVGSVGSTSGNKCGTAGVNDNGIKGCWSRSGVDDGTDVAASVARGVATGVKVRLPHPD
jgi:hypothetical protein